MTLAELQAYIKAKDFNPAAKHGYFLKLVEEVGELAEVIRKERRLADTGEIKGTIDEELYDVIYYAGALANVYGVDLEEAFRLKEAVNAQKYAQRG